MDVKCISQKKLIELLINELPRRKQRGIIKSIERPKGRGIQPLSDGGFKI